MLFVGFRWAQSNLRKKLINKVTLDAFASNQVINKR